MFGAAGMREVRSGMGIASGRLHVRLGAGVDPPTRSVAFGIAHFDAAAVRLGCRTTAEAAGGSGVAQHSRSVRRQRKRTRQQANSQTKKLEEGKDAGDNLLKAHEHEADFEGGRQKNR